MNALETTLLAAIDPERIKQLTLDLAAIPSPTGQSRAAAQAYAVCLQDIGLDVETSDEFPDSPNVVARCAARVGGQPCNWLGTSTQSLCRTLRRISLMV